MMKEKLILLILVIGAVFQSCSIENNAVDCSSYNYSDCNTTEPVKGTLSIKLTINSDNPKVPIAVYSGKLNDNNIIFRDTLSVSSFDTLLTVNNYYTVTAKYKKNGSTIIAVDGDEITKSKTVTCDSTCWSVKTGNANVRLK